MTLEGINVRGTAARLRIILHFDHNGCYGKEMVSLNIGGFINGELEMNPSIETIKEEENEA